MTIRLGHIEFDNIVYDDVADVLYMSVGEPRDPARQEVNPGGHLIRYDNDEQVIGITLVNAKWLMDRDGEIELSLRLPSDDLALALALA